MVRLSLPQRHMQNTSIGLITHSNVKAIIVILPSNQHVLVNAHSLILAKMYNKHKPIITLASLGVRKQVSLNIGKHPLSLNDSKGNSPHYILDAKSSIDSNSN